ncbi:hypothetical protein BDB01DRAFT_776764 [Pilobolus umbonatus]|nr:hypothetical protein BDB01DRAFT_776764 [Pilobolus umbonatus]
MAKNSLVILYVSVVLLVSMSLAQESSKTVPTPTSDIKSSVSANSSAPQTSTVSFAPDVLSRAEEASKSLSAYIAGKTSDADHFYKSISVTLITITVCIVTLASY